MEPSLLGHNLSIPLAPQERKPVKMGGFSWGCSKMAVGREAQRQRLHDSVRTLCICMA